MTSTWPSQSTQKQDVVRTRDMMSSKEPKFQSVEWVVQEQLREVSQLLTSIETKLEVLSQVLWVKDSQELL